MENFIYLLAAIIDNNQGINIEIDKTHRVFGYPYLWLFILKMAKG